MLYDYIVLGAGSGGIASARRAASYGKRVAIVENSRLGGTCVNVGCVPKKVMWNTSAIQEALHEAQHYGFTVGKTDFNWSLLKEKRDAYVQRLNGIYEANLKKDGIDIYHGTASFLSNNQVKVSGVKDVTLDGSHVLIATGSRAWIPDTPGATLGTTSDGFFDVKDRPKRVAVVGAGYIAIELAGIFQTLGAETTLIIRHEEFLRTFDPVIRQGIYQEYERIGIKIIQSSQVIRVEKGMNGLELTLTNSKSENLVMDSFEHLIWAVGRQANTEPLNLGATQVQSLPDGFIRVDEWQNTAANGVYALGDVCGVEMLTPVAIAAGRRLADRIFGGKMGKLDYENIPSVIFSHPTAGSCGLTEQAAVEKYGAGNIKCYTSQFVNMHYSMTAHKPKTHYKLVSLLPSERIVGIHLFGKGSDEILQGFAVAMKMGATKQDFDNTVAIHPTAAEELVTMR